MQHRREGVVGLCSDCPHWDHLATHPANEVVQPAAQAGICRRHAPMHIDMDPRTPAEREDGCELPSTFVAGIRPGMLPNTKGNDWCGEHPLRAAFARISTEDMHRQQMLKTRFDADKAAKSAKRRDSAPSNPPGGGTSGVRS